MSKSDDERNSAAKVLDLVEALSGCVVSGASNGSLSKSLGLSPSTVTVLMRGIINKGWARKDDVTGMFHPTAAMGRVYGRVLSDISREEQRLVDLKHNFTRS